MGQRLSSLSIIITLIAMGFLALSEPTPLLAAETLDVKTQEVRVKMRDGIQLAADLYLPSA
ncbi:MAG: hypothetical protein V3R94_04130, partial [Acidobacteriota bacterium]